MRVNWAIKKEKGTGSCKLHNSDLPKGKGKTSKHPVLERTTKGKDNPKGKGKKGKDALPEPTIELIPEDWNCPTKNVSSFNAGTHGICLVQDASMAQNWPAKLRTAVSMCL